MITQRVLTEVLQMADLIVMDTETTGLHRYAEVIEIAVVDYRSGLVILDTLIQSRESVPPEATAIHGISVDDLAFAPSWGQVKQILWEIFGKATALIYNSAFDLRLIAQTDSAWVRNYGGPPLYLPRDGCVMEAYALHRGDWSRRFGSCRWQKLGVACSSFGIDVPGHDALGDTLATRLVARELAKRKENVGRVSLKELDLSITECPDWLVGVAESAKSIAVPRERCVG